MNKDRAKLIASATACGLTGAYNLWARMQLADARRRVRNLEQANRMLKHPALRYTGRDER